MPAKLLISAGDASGELHAAAVVERLRPLVAGLDVLALGGPALEAAGARILVPQRELAIGGLLEVLGDVGRVARAWRRMTRALREELPELVMLVDSPDFNLPLARRARRLGLRVLWFIGPQVWAWRRRRRRKLAERVDRLVTIFPFEPAFYADAGLRVDFVGHPLVERLAPLVQRSPAECRAALDLAPERPLVALLPGSRRNELAHNAGLQLAAAAALHAQDPRVAFAVGVAPSLARTDVEAALGAARLPQLMDVALIAGRTHELLRAADVALTKPGTVTLEAALLGTPQVVAARVAALSAFALRHLVKTPHWAMPSLVAGERVVPELLQQDADPQRVASELRGLLAGPERVRQLAGLERVRGALGAGGAARRTAEIAREMLARAES
jgi:lipid-A-disaccharide synthase